MLRIATWNVNSIRRRVDAVHRWLKAERPDVLCLQETKCREELFPWAAFTGLGYSASVVGQPAYNGVAILSLSPQVDVDPQPIPSSKGEARSLAVTTDQVRILNVYVPHGDEVGGTRYAGKLRWLDRLGGMLDDPQTRPGIVSGDFNVAPDDRDVYDPQIRIEKLICSTAEREGFARLLSGGSYVDAFRSLHDDGGHYTWWSHRVGAVDGNRGLRVDHHLVHASLARGIRSVEIDVRERKRPGASDHAPVTLRVDAEACGH